MRNVEAGYDSSVDDRRWTMGTGTLSKSFELESWSYVQHKDYQLQLMQKKEMASLRTPIATSTLDRLAFFSALITLTYKREIVTTSQINFSVFIASVTITMLLTILPHYFLVMFLGTYSPEEHFYVSKMVPLFWGCNLQIILSSLLSLNLGLDAVDVQLRLIYDGFVKQLPWTQCPRSFNRYQRNNYTPLVRCFDYPVFKEKVKLPHTKLIYVTFKAYELNASIPSYYFGNSYMHYFGSLRSNELSTDNSIQELLLRISLSILCIIVGSCLFKKWFWKVISIVYWAMNGIYMMCLLYVVMTYLETDLPYIKRANTYIPNEIIDIDFPSVGLTVIAPPLLHLVYARSVQPIDPDWDSGILVAYCFLYTIFRATVDYYVKLLVEADIGFAYNLPHYNMYSSLFYYPLFFSFLPMGDFISVAFFCLRGLLDTMLVSSIFRCLVEILYCEWPWRVKKFRIRRWMISLVISLIVFGIYVATPFYARIYLYTASQIVACLSELLVITLFYPIGRLFDDITFNQGAPPARLRVYTLLILPLYYSFKAYTSLHYLITFPQKDYNRLTSFRTLKEQVGPFVHGYWIINIIPILLGMAYSIIKYVFMNKKKWSSLLRPKPTWGPRDHVTRQLRKQYDSRDYIPSQSSRYLARHMLAKAEAATYRLDVRYESAAADRRRSLATDTQFKMDSDKNTSRYLARHMLAKAEAATYRLDVRYESAAADRRRSLATDTQFKMDSVKK